MKNVYIKGKHTQYLKYGQLSVLRLISKSKISIWKIYTIISTKGIHINAVNESIHDIKLVIITKKGIKHKTNINPIIISLKK